MILVWASIFFLIIKKVIIMFLQLYRSNIVYLKAVLSTVYFLSNHYANISSVVMQSVPRRSGFVTNEQNGQRSSCEACFALTSVKDEFDRWLKCYEETRFLWIECKNHVETHTNEHGRINREQLCRATISDRAISFHRFFDSSSIEFRTTFSRDDTFLHTRTEGEIAIVIVFIELFCD